MLTPVQPVAHIDPLLGSSGANWGQNLTLSDIRPIYRKGTFLKVMNEELLRFSEKQSLRTVLGS